MEGLLLGLLVLACPVGMGVMMWFMGKGMRGSKPSSTAEPRDLAELRREHERLGSEIAELERREHGDPVKLGR